MNKKLVLALKIAAVTLCAVGVILLSLWLFPLIASLSEPENQKSFRDFIESFGVFGILIMLLIQIAQIVIAIIPGEPVEVLMGVMYGTFGGLLLTLAGIAIGQTLVYFTVKKFGMKFASRFVDVEKFGNLKFLKDAARRDGLIFLLFFIPGTPKDVLTYFAPFTGIAFPRFIILSTLARIPSVISSTWAGSTLSDGNILMTLLIFGVTGIIGLAGILINNRITSRKNTENKDAQ